jgi:hypothetical protein
MVVTADGEWVLPDSEAFLATLGDPEPDYDAVAFAVRNLGCIRFEFLDRLVTEIDLHPRNVSRAALEAARQQLLASTARLFRIKYYAGGWQSEISASLEQTVARLEELCAPPVHLPRSERFRTETLSLSRIFDDPAEDLNPLRLLARKWRASFGKFDNGLIPFTANNRLLSRIAIVGIRRAEPDPVMRYVGDAHQWMGDYQFGGIGEKVTNMPDKEYGGWVAPFYDAVATSGEPRYERVTASIQYENEAGAPRRTVHYERLLLPWKAGPGEVLVSSCARIVANGSRASAPSDAVDNSLDKKSAKSSQASTPEVYSSTNSPHGSG